MTTIVIGPRPAHAIHWVTPAARTSRATQTGEVVVVLTVVVAATVAAVTGGATRVLEMVVAGAAAGTASATAPVRVSPRAATHHGRAALRR